MIVRNQVDVKTTAKLGGWRSEPLLLKRYAHPEGSRKVVEDVFGGTKENGPRDTKRLTPILTPISCHLRKRPEMQATKNAALYSGWVVGGGVDYLCDSSQTPTSARRCVTATNFLFLHLISKAASRV
jgi:hypothetical protein